MIEISIKNIMIKAIILNKKIKLITVIKRKI